MGVFEGMTASAAAGSVIPATANKVARAVAAERGWRVDIDRRSQVFCEAPIRHGSGRDYPSSGEKYVNERLAQVAQFFISAGILAVQDDKTMVWADTLG
jgi:hypothetical protein